MRHPPDEMESLRDLNPRLQDTHKRSFQRKLQYLKDCLTSCYFLQSKCYTIVDGKRKRLTTAIRTPILHELEEYSWLHMSHGENFYGLGKYKDTYILFSFKYDLLDEPNVKIILGENRDALIKDAMTERMYARYIKDTSPI